MALTFSRLATATESICAQVKIEIRQEATFARQAFDAHMRINNGLTHISLENIGVEVLFSDEEQNPVLASSDPNNQEALFFVRLDTMDNIADVSGSGSVAPSTSADIHWLIIPAQASVENAPYGKLYYVGARLTYTIGGEEHVVEVTPDYIHVNPLPSLTLDYFLTEEVPGDDPFTPEIEASEPFTLGVRVQNNGHGPAPNFKIDSAQPKIIENDKGLLIEFTIIGSEINGEVKEDSLLVSFGDIAPLGSALGRWLMTCSLSGRFVEFEARYSHADELGGELTSLLEAVNTHWLIQDVLVDELGRDGIRDFLAYFEQGDTIKVFESENVVSDVINQTDAAQLGGAQSQGDRVSYELTVPPTAGFLYAQVNNPSQGGMLVEQAVRSDGKILKPENCWLSKKRVGTSWSYYINLFDANSSGSYTITLINSAAAPQPPVLRAVVDQTILETEQYGVLIEASDPNNTIPTLSVSALPVGATFVDNEDGTGVFSWTPALGQAGIYPLTFTASDGEFTSTERATLTVKPEGNSEPQVDFGASTTSGRAPLEVSFSDSTISLDGYDYWTWDFGDGGAPSHLQNPTHTYYQEGIYDVSLTVVDNDGDSQTITKPGLITVAPEKALPVMEFSTIEVDNNWQTVTFTNSYTDPVISATLASSNESDPAVVRIRPVDETSFEIRLQEGSYSDDLHALEKVNLLIVEAGSYQIGEATMVAANRQVNGGSTYETITLGETFPEVPVVLATIASVNDATAATCRLRAISATSFELLLQEEEGEAGDHGTETVGFIAWQAGNVLEENMLIEVGRSSNMMNHTWQPLAFSDKFPTVPLVSAGLQSDDDSDPAAMRLRNSTVSGVEVKVDEETSADSETDHTSEVVGYIAVTVFDPAADSDGDTLTNGEERDTYHSHPGLVDTDQDGLSDPAEISYWNGHTDAGWDSDSDGDTIINLLDRDSDNDNYRDGLEVQHGYDPADPASYPPLPIMESGTVQVNHEWTSVTLLGSYLEPVLVALPASANDPEPVSVRIQRNPDNTFVIKLQENAPLDGIHPVESVNYMVMEAGRYQAGSALVEAGYLSAPVSGAAQGHFSAPFGVTPVVIGALVGDSETSTGSHLLQTITTSGFDYLAASDGSASGQLAYIASEPFGAVLADLLIEVSQQPVQLSSEWREYPFTTMFPTPPLLVGDVQASATTSPVGLMGHAIGLDSLQLRLQGEGSAESAGIIAIAPFIASADSDNDGLTNGEERDTYGTHPGRADTDGDGLNDGQEVTSWGANWNGDPDGDGLINLLDHDSDNDGYRDGLEVTHGFDPADPASYPLGPIMEYGALEVSHEWTSVSLALSYLEPVLVALPVTAGEVDPISVRIRRNDDNSFAIKLHEDSLHDGIHGAETIHYMVMEAGRYLAGSAAVEAGYQSAPVSGTAHGDFSAPFSQTPVVIAAITADSETTTGAHLVRSVSSSGFDYGAASDGSEIGQLAYIASEPFSELLGDLLVEVSRPDGQLSGEWGEYQLNSKFLQPPQMLVADVQTSDTATPFGLMGREIGVDSLQLRLQGSGTASSVGVIAIGSFVSSADNDNDGLTNGEEYNTYGTDPAVADTDGDGLVDGQEVTHWGASWNSDSDGDGLINLFDPDSDNDGFSDGQEVTHGYDPANSGSYPSEAIVEYRSVTIDSNWHTVTFSRSYIKPVLVAVVTSESYHDNLTIHVRNLAANQAEIRIYDFDNADGQHGTESVCYIVMESGVYIVPDDGFFSDDGLLEAGQFQADSAASPFTVPFSQDFSETPDILSGVSVAPGVASPAICPSAVSSSSLQLGLGGGDSGPVTISYIAWQKNGCGSLFPNPFSAFLSCEDLPLHEVLDFIADERDEACQEDSHGFFDWF